jgi:hypothetical protein
MIGLVPSVAGVVLSLAAGFGLGRVKDAKKLAAVKAELEKVGADAVAEVKKLVADLKAKL